MSYYYKSERANACNIFPEVKEKVWERDNHCCIICGSPFAFPDSHYIRRSHGGLGIEQNIVTMCRRCHRMYDQGIDRKTTEPYIEDYLKSKYPDWDKEKLIYRKGSY